MAKLTFGTCVKIGFGITLGYRLVGELSECIAPVLKKYSVMGYVDWKHTTEKIIQL